MTQTESRISVEGFENQQDFDRWLKEQEENEPNENVLKTFKWFLMKLEEDVKSNTYNQVHCDAIDKYAMKMIHRKLMSEKDVMKFVCQAQCIEVEV